jgi:TonB family protein
MSLLAGIPSELLKSWEGRVVDGQFPLQKWLGGSDHSAVFMTERSGKAPVKAAIKLIWADNFFPRSLTVDAQLSRWLEISQFSHPHLIRLFESGCGEIDNQRFLYVVMEYAEEDLGQILPLRPLSSEEVAGMLPPTVQALASVHEAGFVHSRIKPSNVMAVNDQLKISSDGLRKADEHTSVSSAYDAPELVSQGPSQASDLWSLGATLVAVLTQREPAEHSDSGTVPTIPDTLQEPFLGIARQSLRADPKQRLTIKQLLLDLNGEPASNRDAILESKPESKSVVVAIPGVPEMRTTRKPSRPWVVLAIALAVLIFGFLIYLRTSSRSATETAPAAREVSPTEAKNGSGAAPALPSPAAPTENAPAVKSGIVAGTVRNQVPPEVSRGAESTIHGHVKVSVHLSVDASGNVSEATLVSAGPSQYFAGRALAAARLWKFDPAKIDGKATPSEWVLRFQFGKGSQTVAPTETKP